MMTALAVLMATMPIWFSLAYVGWLAWLLYRETRDESDV